MLHLTKWKCASQYQKCFKYRAPWWDGEKNSYCAEGFCKFVFFLIHFNLMRCYQVKMNHNRGCPSVLSGHPSLIYSNDWIRYLEPVTDVTQQGYSVDLWQRSVEERNQAFYTLSCFLSELCTLRRLSHRHYLPTFQQGDECVYYRGSVFQTDYSFWAIARQQRKTCVMLSPSFL